MSNDSQPPPPPLSVGGRARRLSEVSGGISAIFNPRKLRRNSAAVSQLLGEGGHGRNPSVVVTDDDCDDYPYPVHRAVTFDRSVGGGGTNGPMSGESTSGRRTGLSSAGSGTSASSVPLLADVQAQSNTNAIVTLESSLIHQSSFDRDHLRHHQHTGRDSGNNNNNNNNTNLKPIAKTFGIIRRAIFSKTARKLCCGVFLSLVVGFCWTTIIHAIKRAYMSTELFAANRNALPNPNGGVDPVTQELDAVTMFPYTHYLSPEGNSLYNLRMQRTTELTTSPPTPAVDHSRFVYNAPFFTAWLLTASTMFFYPIHQLTVRFCSCMGRKGPKTMSRAISDAIQGFRERGMTLFQFLGRCAALCCLWLATNYLLLASLRKLRPTEVLALFATTTSFSYVLSWVILHQQFVGVRIMAVILSNMGIALLAYMDGQTHKSETMGFVILAAASAGCAAVFKVSLKKAFGFGATISQQVALIFSVIGLLSVVILWPIFVTLYFTGLEVIIWHAAPWNLVGMAISCFLLVSMLDNFGVTCTFEFFITVGLLFAIPVSAALDIYLYSYTFLDMRLAGIITISIGFCVVLLPENWPDYITRCIRRFQGPPPEEEVPTRYSSALPRLSRAGLDHHLVHQPHHNHHQSHHHSHSHPTSAQSYPLQQYHSHHRPSLASFNPLHHFSNHHF